MELRKLRSPEYDWELIFGCLYLTLLLAAAYFLSRLPEQNMPACRLRQSTGIPCPACGMVRCVNNLTAGRVGEAFRHHPLGTLLIGAAAVFSFYSWAAVLLRLPRIRLKSAPARIKSGAVLVLSILLAANWIYLLLTA